MGGGGKIHDGPPSWALWVMAGLPPGSDSTKTGTRELSWSRRGEGGKCLPEYKVSPTKKIKLLEFGPLFFGMGQMCLRAKAKTNRYKWSPFPHQRWVGDAPQLPSLGTSFPHCPPVPVFLPKDMHKPKLLTPGLNPGIGRGGAFQKKLVGQNGSLTGCSAILRYKNTDLNTEMSTNVTVLHG